jgi:tetratricopeptide (TPR) repeat protein
MFRTTLVKTVFSAIIIYSVTFSAVKVPAQDIVPSDDVFAGSSVFVFRQSRKKPQVKFSSRIGFVMTNFEKSFTLRSRRKFRSAANTGKRTVKAKNTPSVLAKRRAAQRNAANKIRLSNTLTIRAETFLQNNEFDKAVETFRLALKQNPKNTDAKDGLSEALTEKGIIAAGEKMDESAVPFFTEAIQINDQNALAYFNLGEIHEVNERNDKAIENYEKALQINPALTELYTPLGLLLLNSGEIAKAESYVQKAEQASLNDAQTYYLRGLLFYKQNKNNEALAAFQKFVALDPNNVSAHFYQALVFDRLNQNQASIAAYQKTVEIQPTLVPAWFDLGVAYYNAEEYEKAADAYRKALALDPENAEARANLASAYRQMERYAEANGEYKIAAQKIKNDPDFFSEWGFCLGKVNEWSKAIERLRTAQDLSSDAIDYTNLGWAYYNAAKTAEKADKQAEADAQYEQGRATLQKAVELNPRLAAAQYNLGATLNALDDFQSAVNALTQAVDLKNDWVLAINELGVSYRRLKNFDPAVRQFKRAIDLDGKFAPALYNLSELEFARGNKKEARRIQARLKQINPELAQKLDDVISGKILNETKRRILQKIPRIPF